MPIATLNEIKHDFNLKDDGTYFYSRSDSGVITIMNVNDYELLAEENLKNIYDYESDGIWESCLED